MFPITQKCNSVKCKIQNTGETSEKNLKNKQQISIQKIPLNECNTFCRIFTVFDFLLQFRCEDIPHQQIRFKIGHKLEKNPKIFAAYQFAYFVLILPNFAMSLP